MESLRNPGSGQPIPPSLNHTVAVGRIKTAYLTVLSPPTNCKIYEMLKIVFRRIFEGGISIDNDLAQIIFHIFYFKILIGFWPFS